MFYEGINLLFICSSFILSQASYTPCYHENQSSLEFHSENVPETDSAQNNSSCSELAKVIGKENPVLRYAIQVCFRLFYLERPRDVVSYPSFVSLQLVNLYQYRVAMSLNYSSTELNCFNI